MEGLGVAASIIAVVQLTEFTLKLAHKHVGLGPLAFDKTELQSISQSLYAFSGMLQSLQTHLRINEADEARLQTLNHLSEPLSQCKEALELLSDQLENPTFIGKHIVGERFNRKLKKALSVIENARKLVELALLSDQHIIVNAVEQYLHAVAEDVRDVHATLDENRNQLAEWHQEFRELRLSAEHDRILRWLRHADPSTNHNAACKLREPSTGNWLLQSDDFAKWKRESRQFLWLHGIPGCGKTILCSTVLQHVKAICKRDSRYQHIFYYFDFKDSRKQEAAGLLGSALVQLASRNLKTLEEIEKFYGQNDCGKRPPDVQDLISILLSALRSSSFKTYLIIDALDECSQRGEMLGILSAIYQECSEDVNILVTSRKEPDIESVLSGFASISISIQQAVVDTDIRTHLKRRLLEDVKLKKWPLAVKEEMEDALVQGAHGMFRWVVCQLEILRNCVNLPALRQKLKELPKTLDETYNRILTNIPEDCHHEAHAVLQWLTYSGRPMDVIELAEALVVDRKNQVFNEEDRMFDPFSILDICSSLVTLSETGTLQLAHYSVKEYLVSSRIQTSQAKAFAIDKAKAHEYIGEICLIYLLHFDKADSTYADVVDYPFLQYAARFWLHHLSAASSKSIDLTMSLLDTKRSFQSFDRVCLYNSENSSQQIDLDPALGFITRLCIASLFGSLEVVRELLATGADPNAGNPTALVAASARGHLDIVETLLVAGADVNAITYLPNYGVTALWAASVGGHLKTVEKILAAGANVNADPSVSAALSSASDFGHVKVVEILLAAGANDNTGTGSSTAL